MADRFARLTHLSALRGFEAAARLRSFSKAAEELNLSQSAVSHQITGLEDALGLKLFHRLQRHVELSDAGADFLKTAQQALNVLRAGTARLETYRRPESVAVATTHAIASRWLLPRLAGFYRAHPGLSVWLYTTEETLDLEVYEVDLMITDAPVVPGPSIVQDILFPEIVAPVFSPSALPDPPSGPADLRGRTLLHSERPPDWPLWLRIAGIDLPDARRGPIFSDGGLLAEAAAAGQGIGLASEPLTQAAVRDGRLARLPGPRLLLERPYSVVARAETMDLPKPKAFRDWLVGEAAGFRAELAAASHGLESSLVAISPDLTPGGLPHRVS